MSSLSLTQKQEAHRAIMRSICRQLKTNGKPLVLKGGTALFLCYGLDRFSEDLDFDITADIGTSINMESALRDAVVRLNKEHPGASFKLTDLDTVKNTNTVQRVRAVFQIPSGEEVRLKIEISRREIAESSDIVEIDGIVVYTMDRLAALKMACMKSEDDGGRTVARDLHDLVYLATQREDELDPDVVERIREVTEDISGLLGRYADAYEIDLILNGRLLDDMAALESWKQAKRGPSPF